MENLEVRDIQTAAEVIEEVAEAVPAGKNGLKTVAKAGIVTAACVAAWELVVKPVHRRVKAAWTLRKAAKAKKTEAYDVDMHEKIDSIPGETDD